jgi:hypothetical protein
MQRVFFLLSVSLLLSSHLSSSVFLFNDSPYELKAVVVAANGSTLGEKVLASQATGYFEDTLGQSDPTSMQQQAQPPMSTSQYPIVPYTVYWYCQNGSAYATCTEISAGALASPSAGQGPKYCKPAQQQNQSGQDDYSGQ